MSNSLSVPGGLLLFQPRKVLEFGKDIHRLIYLEKSCDVFTFIITGSQLEECWEEAFSSF